jgi:hypothetical protein
MYRGVRGYENPSYRGLLVAKMAVLRAGIAFFLD